MASNGNEFLPNYVEHLVPLQEKRLVRPKKLGVIALACALVLGLVVAVLLTPLQFLGGLIFILLLGALILIWFLWQYTCIEYEYTILGGELNIEVVYGKRKRKPFYKAELRRMEKIAPVNGGSFRREALGSVSREVFCASTMDNPKTWYAIVQEESGERTLLFFELTEKAEKVLRFHNSRAFFGY